MTTVVDPSKNYSDISAAAGLQMYRRMLMIRLFEEQAVISTTKLVE